MFRFISGITDKVTNARESDRTILYNVLGAFGVKGGALIVSFFTMPAYIRYFDNQQLLGLWFTILSVLSWALTFDLGIGNGLRNYLAVALANKEELQAKKYISSAYAAIGLIALSAAGLSTILFRFIDWNLVFNIPEQVVDGETLALAVSIVFSGIMLQFLLGLITSILYAMQKSAFTNLLGLFSNVIILTYVSLAPSAGLASNLITLAVVHVLAVNLPLLLATVVVFAKALGKCRPSLRLFGKDQAKEIMTLGGIFFWVQMMYMVITTTDEFLIAWLTGPERVVEYQIYNRLFTLPGLAFTLALTPIWSAVTKAFAEGRYDWIKKLYKLLRWLALAAIACEFGLIPFLQFAINIWLGERAIQVNTVHALIFAAYASAFVWNGALSSIANGVGELKTQSICFTLGAIIKVPVAGVFVALLDSWIGVVLADFVAVSLYCVLQPIRLNWFLNKASEGRKDYV